MHQNPYLTENIPLTFLKTAFPIAIFMTFYGVSAVIDAYFLGEYIGAAALSAVALTFPIQTLLFSVANLFAKGTASLLARRLGENNLNRASEVFVNAHIVSVIAFCAISAAYLLFGKSFLYFIIGDVDYLVSLSDQYIRVLVIFSPVIGLMILNNDGLRSEGKLRFMSVTMLISALINVVLDYIFLAKMGLGVEASAYATVIGYAVALAAVLVYRYRGNAYLRFRFGGISTLRWDVTGIIPLGLPNCLTLLGMAFLVAVINYNLRIWSDGSYVQAVAAYGVVSRLLTFVMFPMIGMTIAFQSILGNNYGAGECERTNELIGFGLKSAFIYCIFVQVFFWVGSYMGVGGVFVDDPVVEAHISMILRFVSIAFFTIGPIAIIAAKFQALGNAGRAMVLGPLKSFLFTMPLIFILPFFFGELGIWIAIPAADFGFLFLALIVLRENNRDPNVLKGVYFYQLKSPMA